MPFDNTTVRKSTVITNRPDVEHPIIGGFDCRIQANLFSRDVWRDAQFVRADFFSKRDEHVAHHGRLFGVNTNEGIIEDLRLVRVPSIWDSPVAWIILATVVALAIYFFVRWAKSRPLPLKEPMRPLPGPPPHVVALNRLQELRARHPKLSAYDVALECSDILRRYIEARFESPIRFQTTREFLGAAHSSAELNADSRKELGDFLEFFDGIKFAQESAASERTAAAIAGAERFVRKCVPAELALQ